MITLQQKIKLLEAEESDRHIEMRSLTKSDDGWKSKPLYIWDFYNNEYRIKSDEHIQDIKKSNVTHPILPSEIHTLSDIVNHYESGSRIKYRPKTSLDDPANYSVSWEIWNPAIGFDLNRFEYQIDTQSKSNLIPYTYDDILSKVKSGDHMWVKFKSNQIVIQITKFTQTHVCIGSNMYTYMEALNRFEWFNGLPFGIQTH